MDINDAFYDQVISQSNAGAIFEDILYSAISFALQALLIASDVDCNKPFFGMSSF